MKATELGVSGYRARFFTRMEDVPDDWEKAGEGADLFLSRKYLSTLERFPPRGMGFVYLLFYRGRMPVGIAYGQVLPFDASRDIRSLTAQSLKKCLAGFLRFRLLVCGNMLLSGQHAFHFSHADAPVPELLDEALRIWAKSRAIPGILIKDIPGRARELETGLDRRGYHKVQFQPNMVLPFRPGWRGFGDYLAAMSSKYRVRARQAFRNAAELERRPMSPEQVDKQANNLFRLYEEVATGAEVNMVSLHPRYIPALAKAFPQHFQLTGYWREDKLLGYRTTLVNGRDLEAHFLGFRRTENRRLDLYLNMLYDMVEEGIGKGAGQVVYSRTALEIKSSVGAEPREMNVFITSRMAWFNPFIPLLIEWLEPPSDWKRRHPFRTRGTITAALAGKA